MTEDTAQCHFMSIEMIVDDWMDWFHGEDFFVRQTLGWLANEENQ